jgi:ubiquinone/menaquinone biosynthesis C-methylase UbiE
MPTNRELFMNGTYHRRVDAQYGSQARLDNLVDFYQLGLDQIAAQGWTNPLRKPRPTVLQMGTAGFHTSRTFVDFVHRRNPNAHLIIADLSAYPLRECAANGLTTSPNVSLLRTDTRAIDLPPNSVDLLETDAILQFLTPEGKRQALAEWFRILRPGASAMTRDWLLPARADSADREFYRIRGTRLATLTGVVPEETSVTEIKYLARELGFDVVLEPRSFSGFNRYFYHIVLHKPLT